MEKLEFESHLSRFFLGKNISREVFQYLDLKRTLYVTRNKCMHFCLNLGKKALKL